MLNILLPPVEKRKLGLGSADTQQARRLAAAVWHTAGETVNVLHQCLTDGTVTCLIHADEV